MNRKARPTTRMNTKLLIFGLLAPFAFTCPGCPEHKTRICGNIGTRDIPKGPESDDLRNNFNGRKMVYHEGNNTRATITCTGNRSAQTLLVAVTGRQKIKTGITIKF